MSISLKIRELRELKRLSQRELAKICELTPSTISRIEAGKLAPSIKTLEIIAKALNVSIGEIMIDCDPIDNEISPAEAEDMQEWIEAFEEAGITPEQFKSLTDEDRQLIVGLVKKFFNDNSSGK
jgi:transcriptional regulator with XRE-family HTH domain